MKLADFGCMLPARSLLAPLTVLALATGCTSPLIPLGPVNAPAYDSPPRALAGPTERVDATVTEVAGRTAAVVTWDTPEPAESRVVYGEGGAFDHVATGSTTGGALHHEVELDGLAGGFSWQVAVEASGPDTEYVSDPLDVTPAAPTSDIPEPDITTAATDDVSGYTVTVLVSYPAAVVAVLDRQGRYVFWQPVNNIADFRALYDADSNSLLWLANATPETTVLWRCALDGQPEAVATLPLTHHDLTPDPAGGWYVLAYDERPVDSDDGATQDVTGDRLLHVSADGADVSTVWSSWDEFPYTGTAISDGVSTQYPHTNSVSVDPQSGHVLLSLYEADALAMVDPTTGLADWTMGGDDSDWTFQDGETFSRQHSPLLMTYDEQLAVFDNGAGTSADPAEAAVYHLDWISRSATRTWHFDDGGIHRNITTGSVVPVDDAGDMLVAWGSDGVLTQVSSAGEVQFSAQFEGNLTGFTSHLATLGSSAD